MFDIFIYIHLESTHTDLSGTPRNFFFTTFDQSCQVISNTE